MTDTFVGFQRLAQLHRIRLVQPLLIRSSLGAVRQRKVVDGRALLTWPAQYQPSDSFRGHFEFGLKYERTGCGAGGSSVDGFIVNVRKKLHLGQREAAEIFGGGIHAFSRFENGKTKPPLALVKLLKVLDRHPELLNEVRTA